MVAVLQFPTRFAAEKFFKVFGRRRVQSIRKRLPRPTPTNGDKNSKAFICLLEKRPQARLSNDACICQKYKPINSFVGFFQAITCLRAEFHP